MCRYKGATVFKKLVSELTFFVCVFTCVSLAKVPCEDMSLEVREEMAHVVLTGTVKELMMDPRDEGMYKGELEVKRVLKDRANLVPKMANFEDPVSHHLMLMVEGFGDSHICESDVRKYDTKIFLLNPNGHGELKLNSSIVPITLTNLQHADALVKHIPYTKPEKPKLSPCVGHFCAFGAVCMINDTDETKAYCKCTLKCPTVFTPVCGTNGVTYASECLLHQTSCITQRRIKVKKTGECGKPDPCEGEVCKFGAKCVPSIDGTSHRCVCPSKCDSHGDSVGSTPVCGSNGVDYKNMCELHRAACGGMRTIRVKYYGKCDPCGKHKCVEPKICQLDEHRKPICKCEFRCHSDFEPVCGSDGRTYSNECMLKREACKFRKELSVTYKGKCSTGDNPCDLIRCGPEEECSIDRQGRASCVCPNPCEPVMRQVCGNNSVTYDNECELRRKSCLTKIFVTIRHRGVCGGDDVPCRNYHCDYDAECVDREGKPTCDCRLCTEEYDPVCGNNGITYENECKLKYDNCKFKQNIQIKNRRSCNGCENVKCEFYAICESYGVQPRCVCPTSCIPVKAEVCGSDGHTYLNECELKVAACQRKQFISIASTGACNKCADVVCKYGAKCENGACVCPIMCPTTPESVCGSDGRTYSNECEMRRVSCAQSINLDIVSSDQCHDELEESGSSSSEGSGEGIITVCDESNCNFGGRCVLDEEGDNICHCKDNCDALREPVCGSDGKSYGNECELKYESCRHQKAITRVSSDNCDDFGEEEPCDGQTPLVDPLTSKDYDCSHGNSKDACPRGSYCHRGYMFAKCCQEEKQIKSCLDTRHGCCQDGKTVARGPGGSGCPEFCHCNALGAYGTSCDPVTRQCTCRPGVGGLRCDRCQPGYWGLLNILELGHQGCIPCSCNTYGSMRDDCDQMTGRCMCKSKTSINGMKCNLCSDGNLLGPLGCEPGDAPRSCRDMVCKYGAVCEESEGRPECVCDQSCDNNQQSIVCGSDGQNYGSECQLQMFGCRLMKDIIVAYKGPCRAAPSPRTTAPPLSTARARKTTRHIHPGQEETHSQLPKITGTDRPLVSDSEGKCDNIIDQLCISDQDCCVSNSSCRQGLCRCYDQFVPSIKNDQCIEVVKANPPDPSLTNPPNEDACTNNPCHNTGTCQLDDSLGFRCLCPLGKTGPLCKDELFFDTPSFTGKSFLKVPKIGDASKELKIEIVFHTLNRDGIILYNSQKPDGSGDYVSLSMKDGHVEFRFDLGGGEAILKSRSPLSLQKTHRVIARRTKEIGILIVDSEIPVNGASTPTHTSLNLQDPLYLGYVPNAANFIYERIGVDFGLVGCIHSFKAGSEENFKEYNLRYILDEETDIESAADISECGNNPCKSMPCYHGATCIMLDSVNYQCLCQEGYRGLNCEELTDPCASQPCQYGGTCSRTLDEDLFYCACPEGRSGLRCEKEALKRVYVPEFDGDSYIKLPLDDNVGKHLSVEIWFRATKPNGALFFASQYLGGLGDFISLNLVKRKLQFKFYLGTGTADIESKKHIHLNKWHKVIVQRTGEVGEMTVDDQPTISGVAPGLHKELNLGRPLYLGGFKEKLEVPFSSGIETGFTGSIQRIIINGRIIDSLLESAEEMRNIDEYNGAPCNVNPCQNGGVCQPMLNRADCKCPVNFMGEKCHKRADHVDKDQPVSFNGQTFLNYPNEVTKIQEGQRNNHIKFKFRTEQSNGLIAFQNKGETVLGDYLAIAVVNGKIEFSYNLGKQSEKSLHIIQSRVKVSDGEWHSLEAKRELRVGSLQIDDEEPVKDMSLSGAEQLDTDGQLWLGGKSILPYGLPNSYYSNFNGCLDDVTINRQELHLVDSRSSDRSTIAFCT